MRPDLPSGTVTFLFTDVEGSTRLLHELGAEAYAEALAHHRGVIRDACLAAGGVEVDTQGDAFFFAFPTAPGALAAASALTQALSPGPIRVRVGLHTGTPLVADEGYVGHDLHRAARIAAAGHGGQVLVSASTAPLVELELTDLGEHRFKDLTAAERVFQLGEGSFPPLKTLHQTNLPVPSTPFLGRERELAETIGLLTREDVRLLTLTGPGGTGKTRLALQAAGALAERYPAGVWWLPLTALNDPQQVLESASRALGAKVDLAAHIADGRMLLLFDNFEHVAEAATDLASLVDDCPGLEAIVTSREPLHLRGEQEYAVRPFAHDEAVRFFAARAAAADPTFEVNGAVGEICRRLDELPLALELAAARVKALSTAQILERLERRLPLLTGGARDAPERQRTLRATIEWSYDLLLEEEQQLFARLSVFAGGCTLEAAEEICDAQLDVLQSLVDKNLLRFSDERYWMLATILEYAEETLERSAEGPSVRDVHAAYYLSFAEGTGGRRVFEGDQPATMERLALEVDNLRAAIEWSLECGRNDAVQRFGAALWFFWGVRGHVDEGRRLLEPAVVDSDPTTESWVWGALALGELDRGHGGDLDRARRLKEQIVPILRDRGETGMLAGTLADLGDLAMGSGDYDLARRFLEESLALRDDPAAVRGLSRTLGSLVELAFLEGDLERAEQLAEQAVARSAERPTGAHAGWSLERLAEVRRRQNDLEGAEHALRAALRIMHALRHALSVADCLEGLASVELARGDEERAARLVGAAEALRREASRGSGSPGERRWPITLDVSDDARRQGAALGLDEAVEYALERSDP